MAEEEPEEPLYDDPSIEVMVEILDHTDRCPKCRLWLEWIVKCAMKELALKE
jgi:hypothetical protein